MSKKNGIIGALVGVMIVGVVIYTNVGAKSEKQEEKKIQKVKVAQIMNGDTDVVSFRGVVKGSTEVHLAPKTQGRVTKIYKDIGDKVYKNQLIATIDGSELWAQTQIAQEGYNVANDASQNTKELFDKQVSQAKKGRDLAKGAYESAKKGGDEKQISEMKASYEMAKKGVSVAKRARDLQIDMAHGQKHVAQEQLNAARTMASNTQLRAPFTGIIAQSNVEIGSLVSPQMPMFLIVSEEGQEVEISVTSGILSQLEVGQKVDIINDDEQKSEGNIIAISPMVDTHTRKGVVKVALPENSMLGEYIQVLLAQQNETANNVNVPRSAVVKEYHDTFVYVVIDNVVHKKQITISEDRGQNVVIEGDISLQDSVIVEGQQNLSDGDSVEVIK